MWALGAGLGVAVFGFGYKKFLNLKHKKQFFEDFLLFLNGVKTQVAFFQTKLKEIFERQNFRKDFCLFLLNCKNYILSGNKKDFLLYLNSVQFFDKSEHNFVIGFFENFGKVDVQSSCDEIEKFSFFIENKLKTEEEVFKQSGKLTLSLSAMLGLFVFIVIW